MRPGDRRAETDRFRVILKATTPTGFDYEVSLAGLAIAAGWAAGTRAEARKAALDHARERLAKLTRPKVTVPA